MRLIKKRGKLFRKKDKLKFKTVMPDEIGNAEFNSKMCAFLSDASFGLNFDNEKEPVCIAVKSMLRKCILNAVNDGYRHFITGMSMGTDIWAAEIILTLKHLHEMWGKKIYLYAAVPFENQDRYWNEDERLRYKNVLDECDKIYIISNLSDREQYYKRNEFVIQHSNLIVSLKGDDETDGKSITDKAIALGKEVKVIDSQQIAV